MPTTTDVVVVRRRWIVAAPPVDAFEAGEYPSRHATAGQPRRDEAFMALCGRRVTLADEQPGRPAPECEGCDRAWRQAEGITQRDQHRR